LDVARHFGLVRVPFRAVIAPEDAWPCGPFAAAVKLVLSRLDEAARVVALVGPAGSGKSLALRTIAKHLESTGKRVEQVGRPDQLGPELPDGGVLLVDEADATEPDALRTLEAAARRGVQLVVAGEGSFLARLDPTLLGSPVRLSPLNAAEARAFVADRFARTGRDDLFDPPAVDHVLASGNGLPRRIGMLAGAALLEAALDGADAVAVEHVERARAMRAMLTERRPIEPVADAAAPPEDARTAAGANVSAVRRLRTAQEGRLVPIVAVVLALSAMPFVAKVQGQQAEVASSRTPSAAEPIDPPVPQPVETAAPVPAPPPAQLPPADAELASLPAPVALDAAPVESAEPRAESSETISAPASRKAEPPAVVAREPQTRLAEQPTAPAPAPAPQSPPAQPPQVALAGMSSPVEPATQPVRDDDPMPPPASLPTATRRESRPNAALCACPAGMSAARCNEWKIWNCRSKD
jgi:hypothetical protein